MSKCFFGPVELFTLSTKGQNNSHLCLELSISSVQWISNKNERNATENICSSHDSGQRSED